MMTEDKIRRAERRAKAFDLLGEVCADCGTTERLDVDHKNNDREGYPLPSHLIQGDWDLFIAEITNKECQLLCRPCHAKKTHLDRGQGPPQHGTLSGYKNIPCRCAACMAASAEYSRQRRANAKLTVGKA